VEQRSSCIEVCKLSDCQNFECKSTSDAVRPRPTILKLGLMYACMLHTHAQVLHVHTLAVILVTGVAFNSKNTQLITMFGVLKCLRIK